MGGMLQGAALQAAFDMLLKSVVDAAHKIAHFRSHFNHLKSTLFSIKLAIDDVENFNKILERPSHETEAFTVRLLEGEELIRKCSRVKWNVFKRLYYDKKLSNLEASLRSFFQVNVAALHFRESKRISVVVTNLEEKMNEITTILKRSHIGWVSSDEPEQPSHELKGMLAGGEHEDAPLTIKPANLLIQ